MPRRRTVEFIARHTHRAGRGVERVASPLKLAPHWFVGGRWLEIRGFTDAVLTKAPAPEV
jgi:hypothetical protein